MRILVAFLLCFLPSLAMAQDTFLTRFIEDALSGENRNVTVTGFQGALSSRATIEQLTISDDEGVWLTINDAVLDWNRSAILRGRIEVNELSAAEILMPRGPGETTAQGPTPEAQPFALPELPVAIRINSLNIPRVVLGAPLLGEDAEFAIGGNVQLEGGEGTATLDITRTDGPEARFVLDGQYENETRFLNLNLELVEGEGGIVSRALGLPGAPALELVVEGEGVLDDFGADIRLVTDDVERLAGRVTLVTEADEQGEPLRRFATNIRGDIAPLFAPEYREFFGTQIALQFDGLREPSGRVELRNLELAAQAITLRGLVIIGADGLPEQVDVTGRISAADGTPVLLPLTGEQTRVNSVDLVLDFDETTQDGWNLQLQVAGYDTSDLDIAMLSLSGSGQIERLEDGRLIDGTISYAAEGIAPLDPALAEALGPDIGGETQLIWQEGAGLRLPAFTLEGEDYGLVGEARIDGLDAGLRVTGDITARLGQTARFSRIAGRPLSGSALAEVQGYYEPLSGAFDLNANISGQNLSFDQYELDRLLAGESRITLSALRDETGIDLRSLTAQATTLRAEATGAVRSGATDITATLAFADLSVLGGPYGGALTAEARLTESAEGVQQVTLEAAGQSLSVGIDEVDALLAGASTVTLLGSRAGDLITVERLDVNAATLAANLRGTINDGAPALAATLGFSDLSVLGAGYGGAVQAEATFAETDGVQRLEATATGRGVEVGIPEIDGLLAGASTVVVAGSREGEVITLDRLDVDAATLTARLRGTIAEGASNVAATLGFTDLSVLGAGYGGALQAEGTLVEDGTARRVVLDATGTGLSVNQREADLLLQGQTNLSLDVTEDDGAIRVQSFRLTNPQITAEATGDQTNGSRQVNLTARLANLGLLIPEFPGPLTLSGQVTENGAYGIDVTAQGPGGINARVAGTAARNFSTADLAITGSAQAALANVFIQPRSVAGLVNFDLRLNGAPSLAALSGAVTAQGLRIVDPALGITLEQGNVRVDLGGGQATLAASANVAGGGQVTLRGPVGVEAPFNANLTLALQNLALADPELYETTVNGSLAITGPLAGGGRIAGALQLGETNLRIPSTGIGGAGYVPDNLTHVNEPAAVRATRERAGLLNGTGGPGGPAGPGRQPFALDVTISAPNQVFIRGRGLDAELGGQIQLSGTTTDIIPIGEFSLIRGRLDLLGQRFNLDEGSARLQGAFTPFIRLSASTVTDGITVTILVEGPANEPEISFLSSPELPEEEVLARLIFGRGLNNLSPLQAAQLANAVATLSGRGGEGIVGRLREGFGLDDLDITTDEDGEVGLRAGRYLSENVYTDVTVGAGGNTEINLNLDVTPSVTVRGRLGTDGDTGLGVYFERDY